jgi:hypothetical protein
LCSFLPLLIFSFSPLAPFCILTSFAIFEFSPPSLYLCILSSLSSSLYCQFLPLSLYSCLPPLI